VYLSDLCVRVCARMQEKPPKVSDELLALARNSEKAREMLAPLQHDTAALADSGVGSPLTAADAQVSAIRCFCLSLFVKSSGLTPTAC
jgi:hypothetical protein